MKNYILIAIAICLIGCGNEVVDPVDNTVHLAGFIAFPTGSSGGTSPVASYWRDSVYTELTDGEIYSNVTSLYVDGSSVLIGGYKVRPNPPAAVVFWQDGAENVIDGAFGSPALIASRHNNLFGVWFSLDAQRPWVYHKNGITQSIIDTAFNIGPTALAVDGEDMYISGASAFHDGSNPDAKTYQHAQCWKNGELIFRESELSNAMSIFIHQNDIYMAGYSEGTVSPGNTACYWKNGQRIDLTGTNAVALSIFVTGEHVYVSGVVNQQAVYWKDGEMIVLTAPGTYSAANSVFVKGTDVHIGGVAHGYPAYWKNDVRQNIQNQDRFGQIKFVVVGSN